MDNQKGNIINEKSKVKQNLLITVQYTDDWETIFQNKVSNGTNRKKLQTLDL